MKNRFNFLIVLLLAGFAVQAQTPETVTCGKGYKYVAAEIRQLVDFLNLPALKNGETNAQAFGITVKVTPNNVDEWGFGSGYSKGVYLQKFEEIDGIRYIRWLKMESPSEHLYAVKLGGHLQLQNFKYLKDITISNGYLGNKITIRNCPKLDEFLLESSQYYDEDKDPQTERRLEITNCTALRTIQIRCFLTEFITDNNFALENVTISKTNFPCIDFSGQKKLKKLDLHINNFSKITLPKREDYGGKMYSADFSYNPIEPIELIPLIRAYYGDSLFYEQDYETGKWKLNSSKYLYFSEIKNHNIIVKDPVTGVDSFAVGSKIDLSALTALKYGVPEVVSKGQFNWEVYGRYNAIGETNETKKGILTIPNNLTGTTIICYYTAPPLFSTTDYISYTIKVSSKSGKASNFVANIPFVCEKEKNKISDKPKEPKEEPPAEEPPIEEPTTEDPPIIVDPPPPPPLPPPVTVKFCKEHPENSQDYIWKGKSTKWIADSIKKVMGYPKTIYGFNRRVKDHYQDERAKTFDHSWNEYAYAAQTDGGANANNPKYFQFRTRYWFTVGHWVPKNIRKVNNPLYLDWVEDPLSPYKWEGCEEFVFNEEYRKELINIKASKVFDYDGEIDELPCPVYFDYFKLATIDFGRITKIVEFEEMGIKGMAVHWEETVCEAFPLYKPYDRDLLWNDSRTAPLPNFPVVWIFIEDFQMYGSKQNGFICMAFDYDRADSHGYNNTAREIKSGSGGVLFDACWTGYYYELKEGITPKYESDFTKTLRPDNPNYVYNKKPINSPNGYEGLRTILKKYVRYDR